MATAMNNLSAVSLGELRKELGEIVNRATFAGQRTAVTRHGKKVAAIVSVEDLALLDELERRADLEALREARREDDGERISLDDFLAGKDL
ncbi:type II toxin-antitoxin system Phd/YefM family antitoxin [Corynebacterium halotolerans]|nr:type II toxin-antitoxin system Phd/YefM family antitoxin [Corynebacterium halotolerans]